MESRPLATDQALHLRSYSVRGDATRVPKHSFALARDFTHHPAALLIADAASWRLSSLTWQSASLS